MPRLEFLESRFTPATITLSHGVLSVSQQSGPLTVETQGNYVHVLDDVTDAQYKQCKVDKVKIQDTAGDDVVFLLANDGKARYDVVFSGANGGNNTVSLEGHFGKDISYQAGPGTDYLLGVDAPIQIDGDVFYRGGTGDNLVVFRAYDGGDMTLDVRKSHSTFFVVATVSDDPYHFGGKIRYHGGKGTNNVVLAKSSGAELSFGKVRVNLGSSPTDAPDYFADSVGVTYCSLKVKGENVTINGTVTGNCCP